MKKLLKNSIFFFVFLSVFTIVISAIGYLFSWQAIYFKVNPITNDLERVVIAIDNLMSIEGLRFIIGQAVTNFISFAPLGMLIVSLIGIGTAYQSGLLTIIFSWIGKKLNRFWLTFLVVILGIMSNFGGEIGYVLLIPLAALLFLVNRRNPIAGIIVAFVSIASGFGINFIMTNLDYNLISYTELSGLLIDESFSINIWSNLYFNIVSSFVLAFFITYLTEKIIIPRMPKYKHDDETIIEEIKIARREKRGLILAAIGFVFVIIIFIYMFIPNLSSAGFLLDKGEATYLGKLFGSASYFNSSLIYMISFLLVITGLLYGLGAKTIRSGNDISNALSSSLNNIGNLLLLLFFASQFIAIFKKTNLGIIITIWLVKLIELLNFSSLPLIIIFFVLVGISNIFLPSSIIKWSILSPIVVPLLMKSNITPAFAQAVFKISDSVTNIITPSFVYFVIFIGFVEFYNRQDNNFNLSQSYQFLIIYMFAISALWLFVIMGWYILGLPIGLNVYPIV